MVLSIRAPICVVIGAVSVASPGGNGASDCNFSSAAFSCTLTAAISP